MNESAFQKALSDPRVREAASTLPVYAQFPFIPVRAAGCDIITEDGRQILDLYGGHAVAALGYAHPRLVGAIQDQAQRLLFQSNAVALEIRAEAAEHLVAVAPDNLTRAFFVNSGAEANENALRMAILATGRKKILAITQGFHGRTAAAAAVTWNARENWYGFPYTPFDVDFIPRNDVDAVHEMVNADVAAVIFEPVQGVAGAFDLSMEFVEALRQATRACGALLIADEVQSGMGRSGRFFAVQALDVEPDLLTSAKGLAGGIPCGAVLASEDASMTVSQGSLGSTFGGGPVAVAAILAVIQTIREEDLLANVRRREAQIREHCVVGPVRSIQGMGLLLGLVCDRPAKEVQSALLEHDILTGTSSDPDVLRLLPPLVLQSAHVARLADTLATIAPAA
ncbi:MAG: aminotransferase class III-fold pyridoxal phosphate-dependent enzyme [Gammaproteobacteria bacterium]|nr:aminotransferase class III-fold pyridoxal phosphate-dependent enzyme [Gammaproteobacteria bacterium]